MKEVASMRRFIPLVTIALLGAAVITQWQRVKELGRQVLRKGPEEASGSAEENKAVARREFEEMYNQGGNLDAAEEIYAPNFVGHEPTSGESRGVEGAKQFAASYRQAFPDLECTIEEQVAEGEKVVSRWRARGTHQGETEDLGPPTGNRVEITGISMSTIAEGKLVEDWTNFDAMGMMQQLGMVPEAAQQAER
jgi:predicted ester cyclase